jgi:hypothetical protein
LNDSRWRGGRYLAAGEMESKLVAIGQCTHTGRPLGTGEFVGGLEKMAQRRLAPQKRGHREKIVIDRAQSELSFDPLMIKIAVSRMGSQGPGSDLSHFPVFSNFSLQPF